MSVKVYEENVRSMILVMAFVAPPVPAPVHMVSWCHDAELFILTNFYNVHPGKAMDDLSNCLGKKTGRLFGSHRLHIEMIQHVVS